MISIAMTTYNGEKYIKEQLKSIMDQSMPVDEIVICDDMSTDHTLEIINYVIKNSNINIKIIKNKQNIGYINNFYQAISQTHGDYIFLADQDDIWHSDKVEKMVAIMKESNCAALCSGFSLIDADNNKINNINQFEINPFIKNANRDLTLIKFHKLVFGNIVQGCTYCFTKEVKEAYLKIHNEELIHDHQIMFIASLIGKVYFLKEKLIDYRIHATNTIGFKKKKDSKTEIKLKMPSKKPFMVEFLDDVDRIVHVPHKTFYKALYYLRIPYVLSKIMYKFR